MRTNDELADWLEARVDADRASTKKRLPREEEVAVMKYWVVIEKVWADSYIYAVVTREEDARLLCEQNPNLYYNIMPTDAEIRFKVSTFSLSDDDSAPEKVQTS